jgi:hypothetical protein
MNRTPQFMAAMTEPLRFVETLGADHPDTLRVRIRALALAPDEVQAEMEARARELHLLPESDGFLEDGTPMIRLDHMAAKTWRRSLAFHWNARCHACKPSWPTGSLWACRMQASWLTRR